MNVPEVLQKLSDSEKAKLLEDIVNSINPIPENCNAEEEKSSEKRVVGTFLNKLINRQKTLCEGDPGKKQKTLDSWLIKPNTVSPCKTIVAELSSQTKVPNDTKLCSDSDNISNCSDSNVLDFSDPVQENSLGDPDVSCSFKSAHEENQSTKSVKYSVFEKGKSNIKGEKTPPSNIISSGIVTEKYNLRPKRKCTESSNKSGSPYKCFKCNCDNYNTSVSKTKKEILLLQEADISNVQNDSLPENMLMCSKDNCNQLKNNLPKINNSDISLNKAIRNLRSKKKDLKSQDSNVTQSQDSVELETKFSTNVRSKGDYDNSDNTESPTTLPFLQSDYEAFHILNSECTQIGLNIVDVLQDEKIQNILNSSNGISEDAMVLLGCIKSSSNKNMAVAFLVESKKNI